MNVKQLFTLVLACTFAAQTVSARDQNFSPEMIALAIRNGSLQASDTVCYGNKLYTLTSYSVKYNDQATFALADKNSPEDYIDFTVEYGSCDNCENVNYANLPCKVTQYQRKNSLSTTGKIIQTCNNIMGVASSAFIATGITGGTAIIGVMAYKMATALAKSEFIPSAREWRPMAPAIGIDL